MHEVHVKRVGLNAAGEIEFIADFPHERCLNISGELDESNPCQWCDHRVSLHPEALASRMRGYGLATPEAAFDAIVREHALSLHHTLGASHPHMAQKNGLAPQDGSLVGVQGGLHSGVRVVHGQHRLSEVLAFHRELIDEALDARKGQPLYSAEALPVPERRSLHHSLVLKD